MRVLITALLVAACAAFAPVASAQTAGPSVPPGSATQGEVRASPTKARTVHRVTKKRVSRHSVRKARAVAKPKVARQRAPAKPTAAVPLPARLV